MEREAEGYRADQITVLSGLEAVRRRPGMYVGDVGSEAAVHGLLWEVVSNSINEHLAGHGSRVRISVEGGLAEVEDDGRGIPVEWVESRGASALDLVFTCLYGGARRKWPPVHVSMGSGLGLAVVNALCEELSVESRHRGYRWQQRYARGVPVSELERGPRTERTGTTIRFRLDRSIFTANGFNRAAIRSQLEELALWNPSLRFELMAEAIGEPRGVLGWVERLARESGAEAPKDVFATRSLRDDLLVEIALGWSDTKRRDVRSFVGQRETPDGGSHERGLWQGLVGALVARRPGAFRGARIARLRPQLEPGLFGVVHVGLSDPSYSGATHGRLASDRARDAVRDHLLEAFSLYLDEHPRLSQRLLARLG